MVASRQPTKPEWHRASSHTCLGRSLSLQRSQQSLTATQGQWQGADRHSSPGRMWACLMPAVLYQSLRKEARFSFWLSHLWERWGREKGKGEWVPSLLPQQQLGATAARGSPPTTYWCTDTEIQKKAREKLLPLKTHYHWQSQWCLSPCLQKKKTGQHTASCVNHIWIMVD